MNPSDLDALAQLRDIHLPQAVSLWPLASGWWVAAASILALGGLAYAVRRVQQRRARSWQALSGEELARIEQSYRETQDAVTLAAELSALLRRAAMARSRNTKVAALSGDDWYRFVCEESNASGPASLHVLRELSQTAYCGRATDALNPTAWVAFVDGWISEAR